MSWKITHLRPPVSTYSVASSCQQAFGRRIDEPAIGGPRLLPSARLAPRRRLGRSGPATRSRARAPCPSVCILSWTLIGPWSSPDCSSAARTAIACRRPRRPARRAQLRPPRRGSSAAAGPSLTVRLPDLVERLPRDAVLGAERRHRPARRIRRPLRDRETDTRINRLILRHRRSRPAPDTTNPADSPKCHHQHPRKCHRCPDTDPSPMSCDITSLHEPSKSTEMGELRPDRLLAAGAGHERPRVGARAGGAKGRVTAAGGGVLW